MWKRKPKHKTIDEQAVRDLIFKLPGVDNVNIIPAGIEEVPADIWDFITGRKRPKPILEILLERALEERRKAQQ